MIRSPWRPHFSQSICSHGRTCLFCLSCSQGYVPWLDKKSCWWLIISLSMMAIELITSNSLFCLARNIKLFWLFSKYSPIPNFQYDSLVLWQKSIIFNLNMRFQRPQTSVRANFSFHYPNDHKMSEYCSFLIFWYPPPCCWPNSLYSSGQTFSCEDQFIMNIVCIRIVVPQAHEIENKK